MDNFLLGWSYEFRDIFLYYIFIMFGCLRFILFLDSLGFVLLLIKRYVETI